MNQSHNIFDAFTKQYQVQKCVKFALTPVGQTEQHMIAAQYLEAAHRKDQAYQIVKPVIDQKFRTMIDRVLDQCTKQDWVLLEEKFGEYQRNKSEKTKKDLTDCQDKIRKNISKEFETDTEYKSFFKDATNLFKTFLPEYMEQINASKQDKEAVNEFQKFKTYFENFFRLRKDIFSADAKQNTISNRIVNENFLIFLGNKKNFADIVRLIPNAIPAIEKEGTARQEWGYYEITEISKWFETENFQMCMSQWGIQRYNFVIGCVNSFVNQYLQQHVDEVDIKRGKLKLRTLFKQILSDRQMPSWLPEQFAEGREGEEQIYDAIRALEEKMCQDQFEKKYELFIESLDGNNSQVYIAGSAISRVSVTLNLGWDGLINIRRSCLTEQNGKRKREQEIEKILKQEMSLAELSKILWEYAQKNKDEQIPTIRQYTEYGLELLQDYKTNMQDYHQTLADHSVSLVENEKLIETLKAYLDAIHEMLHFLNVFVVGEELDKDADVYAMLDELLNELSEIVPLYNKVRNYVTRKNYSLDKMRVMFERSDFLGGWGQSFDTKEALIFQKENLYYIGVVERKYAATEVDYLYADIDNNNRAIRFVYNFQKADNKNIPRTFIRSKGENYAPAVTKYHLPIEDIIEIYDAEKFKTKYKKVNEEEYYQSLEKLIDYFKDGILKNENYSKFHFQWRPSNEYENIAEFYKDTDDACFSLEKEEINFEHLLEQVEQGRIYLFQVASKDFREKSIGTPNLQTLYWRALFSEENMRDGMIKLCGGASIYLREPSIKKPVVHQRGTMLLNRWYIEDGENKAIPNDTYTKYSQILQGRIKEEELGQEELRLWKSGLLQVKEASHDIVKDKRFTKRQYMLHAPLTINYKQPDTPYHFNDKVRAFLKNNPDVNIIGIDRGERNLLYITIIDQQGNILPDTQRSYNQIEQKVEYGSRVVDYYGKLQQVEERHDAARKSWKQIGTIRELKEGYLSQVVHEITQLMIEYNAIIVMENLNMGFKKGRMKVERNVYQKFEKMLIDKLNYLAFKKDIDGNPLGVYETGGIMNGYQLTDKFTSFKDMGTQNGFLFYVPAAYTSAIDPITGFVDVFQKAEMKTLHKMREFLLRFDDISWDTIRQSFVFSFDYGNFKCSTECYRKKWSLYADVNRIETEIVNKRIYRQTRCNPNRKLMELFDQKAVSYQDGHNLIPELEHYDDVMIKEIVYCFKLILHLRNSMHDPITGESIDAIISPVMYQGKMFNSEEGDPRLPVDADANGAYHIALKGLLCLQRINQYADDDGKMDYEYFKIRNIDWFQYMQTRKDMDV